MKIATELVKLAFKEVGVREVGDTNCGPRVDIYKAATNLPPHESWAWCAAFMCFIVMQALKNLSIPETKTFKRPTTAGARDFIRWSKEQDNTTSTKMYPSDSDIEPGDILVFDNISHIGIAVKKPKGGYVETVEGNTNEAGSRDGGGVYNKKARLVSNMRARIRFTI